LSLRRKAGAIVDNSKIIVNRIVKAH
jgi:hypothetical protein